MTAAFLDKKTIAELTARMYLDTGAVRFMADKPFIFTSGWASPVYNDSRWLISFPEVRSMLMDFTVAAIWRDIGRDKLDAVAQKLLEVETITREEFEAIFPPPMPKRSGTPQPAMELQGAPAS